MEIFNQPVANRQSGASSRARPVLVPVDFSNCSRAALTFATNFCASVDAPLVVLHVVHEPNNAPGFYRRGGTSGAIVPMEHAARAMLQDFVDEVYASKFLAGIARQPRLMLMEGLPATRIHEAAIRERAALIVIGTHGRRGLSRLAMGSVATEVAQECKIPVTIVKSPSEATDHVASEWWVDGDALATPDLAGAVSAAC